VLTATEDDALSLPSLFRRHRNVDASGKRRRGINGLRRFPGSLSERDPVTHAL